MKRASASCASLVLLAIGLQLRPPDCVGGTEAIASLQAPGIGGFTVPAGFRVELAVEPPADKSFSPINCCFDHKGRLLVANEKGQVSLCLPKGDSGVLNTSIAFCDNVQSCQGMTWIADSLWLIGDGPKGTGLYRCNAAKNGDQIDDVVLVHAFKGGMGENGPHSVVQGPDGMIYFALGHNAWAQLGAAVAANGANPSKLAANSPLTRWPTGGGPLDQGKQKKQNPVAKSFPIGGSIWRMDPDGKNVGLVASGFRNASAISFGANGEFFTNDGDPEADEGLPWYRPARICLCPPGADFVWRASAANTPDYAIDSLPPVAEVAHAAAGGMAYYDHTAFPREYRGAFFMADAQSGTIHALHLQRDGASCKVKVERFCHGPATPVTNLTVGPEGALYFVAGGGQGHGGVYRIVSTDPDAKTANAKSDTWADWPQPQAAWSQKKLAAAPLPSGAGSASQYVWEQFLNDPTIPAASRIRMTTAFQQMGQRPQPEQIMPLLKNNDAELRAHAVWLIGVNGFDKAAPELFQALADPDPLVRRRSCEAIIRIGVEPPIDKVWPLLNEKDRFVRSSARLVLERIDPKKWVDRVWTKPKSYKEINETNIWNGIIALCHAGKMPVYIEEIFGRLHGDQTHPKQGAVNYPPNLLEWLRTVEVTLAHTERRPIWTAEIARQCEKLFPHADSRVNRELAMLLADFQRDRVLEKPIQPRLLRAMAAKKDDHMQQVHYAYCMRQLRTGWTPDSANALTQWYEETRGWTGGRNLAPVLESIYKESAVGFGRAGK
jgi:glucose/arabinose dehydrogenase